jgi:hypothetical protein
MHHRPRGGPHDHDWVVTMAVAEAVAVGRRVAMDRSMTIGRSAIDRDVVVMAVDLPVTVMTVPANVAMVANMAMMAESMAVLTVEVMAVADGVVAMSVTRAMTGLGGSGRSEAECESDGDKSFHGPDPFRWLGAGEVARVRPGDRCNPSFMSIFIEQCSKYINKKLTVSL